MSDWSDPFTQGKQALKHAENNLSLGRYALSLSYLLEANECIEQTIAAVKRATSIKPQSS
jgi:hypothetical protein